MFLRYHRFLLLLFGPASVVTAPAILCLSLVNNPSDTTGLDRFGWANIPVDANGWYWALIGCTTAFVVYFLILLTWELDHSAQLKQSFLACPLANTPQVVWLTDIPATSRSLETLQTIYKRWDIKDIHLIPNVNILKKLEASRDSVLRRLEHALLAKICRVEDQQVTVRRPVREGLPSLALIDEKVDEVQYLVDRLVDLNKRIELELSSPSGPDALFLCPDRFTAESIGQCLSSSRPGSMNTRYLETNLGDIEFWNLNLSWQSRHLRDLLVQILALGLIVLWAIPIGFTGALSQVDSLAQLVPLFQPILQWPRWTIGIIQGVLPSLMLSLLMLIFPIILFWLVNQQRPPTRVLAEILMQKLYFLFLFTHLFVTVSITSGLVATLARLATNLSSLPALLAQNLPRASNYFLSFILLQALGQASNSLMQPTALFKLAMAQLSLKSPRDLLDERKQIDSIQWSTIYPLSTTLASIVIIYSSLAPLILPVATFAFGSMWFFHRYIILYVAGTRVETGGENYRLAMFQLFLGLYLLELCLLGLFLLKIGSTGIQSIGQVIVLSLLFISTAVYHGRLSQLYCPLFQQVALTRSPATNLAWSREKRLGCAHDSIIADAVHLSPCSKKSTSRECPLDIRTPRLWLPRDESGICDLLIARVRELSGDRISIATEQAALNSQGRVILDSEAQDYPEAGSRD